MLPIKPDFHRMTRTELELKAHEVGDEIRDLRGILHDLGPGQAREEALLARRILLDDLQRELAHRASDRSE